jgi:hypothetical protein
MEATPLSRSLASWREAHGVGILCIVSPTGEHFAVHSDTFPTDDRSMESWPHLSEGQARNWLLERGVSAVDADDAIGLAREWATSITGAGALARPFKPV